MTSTTKSTTAGSCTVTHGIWRFDPALRTLLFLKSNSTQKSEYKIPFRSLGLLVFSVRASRLSEEQQLRWKSLLEEMPDLFQKRTGDLLL